MTHEILVTDISIEYKESRGFRPDARFVFNDNRVLYFYSASRNFRLGPANELELREIKGATEPLQAMYNLLYTFRPLPPRTFHPNRSVQPEEFAKYWEAAIVYALAMNPGVVRYYEYPDRWGSALEVKEFILGTVPEYNLMKSTYLS